MQIGAECIALWESLIGSCVLKKKLVPKMLETFRGGQGWSEVIRGGQGW